MNRSRAIGLLGFGAALGLLAFGCSDQRPEAAPGLKDPVSADKTCEALPAESISSLFAVEVELDESRSGPSSCAYVSTDGTKEVLVRFEDVPSAAAMDVVVSEFADLVGGEPEDVDPGDADQVVLIGGGDAASRAMVVRKGGFGAQLELSGFTDEVINEARPLVVDWLLGGFPEAPFDATAVARTIDCDEIDESSIANALDVQPKEVSITPSVGTDSCDLSIDSGPSVRIHAPTSGASANDLLAFGRIRTVDGTEYRSDPEAVEGLGDAAVWVLEPQAVSGGDLYVVSGDQMLRVTVSGDSSDPEGMKATAIAVAKVVPPSPGA